MLAKKKNACKARPHSLLRRCCNPPSPNKNSPAERKKTLQLEAMKSMMCRLLGALCAVVQANYWVHYPSQFLRQEHSAAWSELADAMYVFGGWTGYAKSNSLLRYERKENIWLEVEPSGSRPSARYAHSAVWSEAADAMYVFGGTPGGRNYFNDLYKYDRKENSWIDVKANGSLPPARHGHSAVWSEDEDAMYVYSGVVEYAMTTDFWKYERKTNRWFEVPVTGIGWERHCPSLSLVSGGGIGGGGGEGELGIKQPTSQKQSNRLFSAACCLRLVLLQCVHWRVRQTCGIMGSRAMQNLRPRTRKPKPPRRRF